MDGDRPKVVLSVGLVTGEDQVTSEGYSNYQVLAATVKILRHLLKNNYDIVFGGSLKAGKVTTQILRQAVKMESDGKEPRLTSYQVWPSSVRDLNDRIIADDLNFVKYETVKLPDAIDYSGVDPNSWQMEPHNTLKSIGLSLMRERTSQLGPRVLIGGLTENWPDSRIPGIFEECLFSLLHGQKVFLVGGFGGATRQLADFIAGEKRASETDIFKWETYRDKSWTQETQAWIAREYSSTLGSTEVKGLKLGEDYPQRALEALGEKLEKLRKETSKSGDDGATDNEKNLAAQLATSTRLEHICQLITKGLKNKSQ